MIDQIRNYFSEHHSLLQQRADLEADFKQRDTEFSREIEALENAPVTSLKQVEELREQISAFKYKHSLEAADYQIRRDRLHVQIIAAAPPAIDAAIRRLLNEREQTCKALRINGGIEKNRFGSETGYVDSNAPKIKARVVAIDIAISKLALLKTADCSNVSEQISEIESAIPRLDSETERLDGVSTAVARGLEYPRVSQ